MVLWAVFLWAVFLWAVFLRDGVVVMAMASDLSVMTMASDLSVMTMASDLSVMTMASDLSVMTDLFEKHRGWKISWADENLGGNERVLVTVPLLLPFQAANLSLDAPKQPAFGLVRAELVRAEPVRAEPVRAEPVRAERRDLGRHSVCFFAKRKERFDSVFPMTVRLVCLTVRLVCPTVRLVCPTVRLVCPTVRLVCLTVRLVCLTVRLVCPTNHPMGGGFHRCCFVLGLMERPLGSVEQGLCLVRCWCFSALCCRAVVLALCYRAVVLALYHRAVVLALYHRAVASALYHRAVALALCCRAVASALCYRAVVLALCHRSGYSGILAFFLYVVAYCGEFVCVVGAEREVGFVCGVVGG